MSSSRLQWLPLTGLVLLALSASTAWAQDCDNNGVPDAMELSGGDCNTNGVLDRCEAGEPVTRLLADDAHSSQRLGQAVGVSGLTVAAGAYGDNDQGSFSGAVYVFRRLDGAWSQEAKLLASNGAAQRRLGLSVAIDGDVIVAGAPELSSGPTQARGAAYIFRRTGGAWSQEAYLVGAGTDSLDYVGQDVDLSGDTAIVGSRIRKVFFYRYNGASWQEEEMLTNDGYRYGEAVSIDGDTAVIADEFDNDVESFSGAVYVYDRVGGDWSETTKLKASDAAPDDHFGCDIDLKGDLLIVGANSVSDVDVDAGAAYIFRRVNGLWQEEAKLTAPDGERDDEFGVRVAIDNDRAVIGTTRDDVAYKAYVFHYSNGVWAAPEIIRQTADGSIDSNSDGSGVAIDGDRYVIGMKIDPFVGLFGGAAYVYDRDAHSDCNADGILDECQLDGMDCDNNGVLDVCELAGNDCNGNGVLDACDPIDAAACPEAPRPEGCANGEWARIGAMGPDSIDVEASRNTDVSDNRLVIGAFWDDSAGENRGTVFVYRRDGTTWVPEAQLFAPPEDNAGYFGIATQIDGNVLAVTARGSVDGTYLYHFVNGEWQLRQTLLAPGGAFYSSDYQIYDNFGEVMALDADRLVMCVTSFTDQAAPYLRIFIYHYLQDHWELETRIDEDQFTNAPGDVAIDGNTIVFGYRVRVGTNTYEGRVRIFEHDGFAWNESTIEVPAGADLDDFGRRGVTVRGDRVVVAGGTTYVFEPVNGVWTSVSSVQSEFNTGVALTDDFLAIGGSTVDTGLSVTGAVGIFRETGGQWTLTDRIDPPDEDGASGFGARFVADGRKMLVTARDRYGASFIYRTRNFLYELGLDCDGNGALDDCEIANGAPDLDGNALLDACGDPDCDQNGVPDAIEPDCDLDGVPDACEVDPTDPDGDGRVSDDCDGNGVPDECELAAGDCNGNLTLDVCEIAACVSGGVDCSDCNGNGLLDSCEGLADCDGDGFVDACDPMFDDCNLDGVPDACELAAPSPVIEFPELLPSPQFYNFGRSFDLAKGRLVVGCPEGSHTTQSYERAFVYRRTGDGWEVDAELTPSDGYIGDRFGEVVAIDGDTIIVLAPRHDFRDENGVILASNLGAMYVFELVDGAWLQREKLMFPYLPILDIRYENGILGFRTTSNVFFARRDGNEWSLMKVITNSGSQTDRLVGGGPFDMDAGRVLFASTSSRLDIYRIEGDQVVFEQSMTQSVTGSLSQSAIDVDADLLAIGDSIANGRGAVYLYRRVDGVWTALDTLTPPAGTLSGMRFGFALDIDDGRLAVSAPYLNYGVPQASGGIYQYDTGSTGASLQRTFVIPRAGVGSLGLGVLASSGRVFASYVDLSISSGSRQVIEVGLSDDCNANGTPDTCERTIEGIPMFVDILLAPTPTEGCQFDMNGDGLVNGDDIQGLVDAVVGGA
ncbi:MAG TPA: hypothetical protein P5081_00195 [Phycisphaerae bacterium]|nr:hypothetical protein [Phycisphaerae bacterium]HRW51272.1 hypothetical protein [Phycisphaerae bacterium]